MKRKLLILTILLTFSLSLAACGKKADVDTTEQNSENNSENDFDSTDDESSETTSSLDDFSYDDVFFTISGKTYSNPMTLSDLYENGWKYKYEDDSSIFLENESDTWLSVASGTTRNPKTLSQDEIDNGTAIIERLLTDDDRISIIGIKVGMSKDEVKKIISDLGLNIIQSEDGTNYQTMFGDYFGSDNEPAGSIIAQFEGDTVKSIGFVRMK